CSFPQDLACAYLPQELTEIKGFCARSGIRRPIIDRGPPWRPCPRSSPAQGGEHLVELRERLAHRIRRAGAGSVERFLGGIELVQDQQRLAAFLLEGDRGDGTLGTFLVGPDQARGRGHFEVPAEEREGF